MVAKSVFFILWAFVWAMLTLRMKAVAPGLFESIFLVCVVSFMYYKRTVTLCCYCHFIGLEIKLLLLAYLFGDSCFNFIIGVFSASKVRFN